MALEKVLERLLKKCPEAMEEVKKIQEHIRVLEESLLLERDRRKQLQPGATAYQALRRSTLDVLKQTNEHLPWGTLNPRLALSLDRLEKVLAGLPRTLDG
jgi:hypothetical protein